MPDPAHIYIVHGVTENRMPDPITKSTHQKIKLIIYLPTPQILKIDFFFFFAAIELVDHPGHSTKKKFRWWDFFCFFFFFCSWVPNFVIIFSIFGALLAILGPTEHPGRDFRLNKKPHPPPPMVSRSRILSPLAYYYPALSTHLPPYEPALDANALQLSLLQASLRSDLRLWTDTD